MSFGGRGASSSRRATGSNVLAFGLTGFAAPSQRSLHIGSYVMATAEHREPCESRDSCTVLGARGGEIPPRDSTKRASSLRSNTQMCRAKSAASIDILALTRHIAGVGPD